MLKLQEERRRGKPREILGESPVDIMRGSPGEIFRGTPGRTPKRTEENFSE